MQNRINTPCLKKKGEKTLHLPDPALYPYRAGKSSLLSLLFSLLLKVKRGVTFENISSMDFQKSPLNAFL